MGGRLDHVEPRLQQTSLDRQTVCKAWPLRTMFNTSEVERRLQTPRVTLGGVTLHSGKMESDLRRRSL
eukprot:4946181-Amphidinium_carterae.1